MVLDSGEVPRASEAAVKGEEGVRELAGVFPEEKRREERSEGAERRWHPRGSSSPERRKKSFGELGAELGEVQRR